MKTQEQQLDYALGIIQNKLTEWGLDDWLGHRTPETMRLSVDGAINVLDLINTLTGEINRLEQVTKLLEEIIFNNKEQYLLSEQKAGNQ
jgi:hypothetical protein